MPALGYVVFLQAVDEMDLSHTVSVATDGNNRSRNRNQYRSIDLLSEEDRPPHRRVGVVDKVPLRREPDKEQELRLS